MIKLKSSSVIKVYRKIRAYKVLKLWREATQYGLYRKCHLLARNLILKRCVLVFVAISRVVAIRDMSCIVDSDDLDLQSVVVVHWRLNVQSMVYLRQKWINTSLKVVKIINYYRVLSMASYLLLWLTKWRVVTRMRVRKKIKVFRYFNEWKWISKAKSRLFILQRYYNHWKLMCLVNYKLKKTIFCKIIRISFTIHSIETRVNQIYLLKVTSRFTILLSKVYKDRSKLSFNYWKRHYHRIIKKSQQILYLKWIKYAYRYISSLKSIKKPLHVAQLNFQRLKLKFWILNSFKPRTTLNFPKSFDCLYEVSLYIFKQRQCKRMRLIISILRNRNHTIYLLKSMS